MSKKKKELDEDFINDLKEKYRKLKGRPLNYIIICIN